MPHHAEWTRQTKANNCILVNGQGQAVRDLEAAGRIADFRHQKAITYVCGDAAAAYKGKLQRFLRHVLFLRPGVFMVLDELAAPEPAQFSWLLHAFDRMDVDRVASTVVATRHGASLTAHPKSEAGLVFHQSDVFDTPYNEGNPPEYHEKMANQWHFSARTEIRAPQTRIAAAMAVRGPGEDFVTGWKQHPGWLGVGVESDAGSGQLWAQTAAGAPGHPSLPNRQALLTAIWRPAAGGEEIMVIEGGG
jgi:hypothetical protein